MRKLQVLLVEDSADDAELVARTLRRGGCDLTYHRVETPEAMQAALARPGWDLVIADYSMPHFSGLEALKLLREKEPDLPFILVSATVGEDVAVQAMKAGANDYVLKQNLVRLWPAVERELGDTEVRRARRQAESRYRNLFNNVPVGVLINTPDARVLETNPTFVKMLGLERGASFESLNGGAVKQPLEIPVAMDFRRFVQPGDWQRFDELLEQAQHGAADGEFDLLAADGTQVAAHLSVRFADVSELAGVCMVVTDITARKRTEEQVRRLNSELEKRIIESNAARDTALELAKLRSEFLANTSHEIRTPLNSIIGLSELVLDSPLTNDQRTDLESIGAAANNLLVIINNILDFSRIAARQLALDSVEFETAPVFERVIDLVAVLARRKGLELALGIKQGVPSKLYGDPYRLLQVLTNLVGNAIKFTARGCVTVSVALERPIDQAVTLRCEVRDTGIGIAPEDRPRLFHPFSQVDGSMTRRFGGTGLGLAIASELVALMGGRIGVESEVGANSTFWFSAKFGKAAPGAKTGEDGRLQGRRILIVSTVDEIRHLLANQVTSWGMRADSARSAAESLTMLSDKAAKQSFDAILVHLPGEDASTLTERIRAEEKFGGIRVILIPTVDSWHERGTTLVDGWLAGFIKPTELFGCLTAVFAQAPSNGDSKPLTFAEPDALFKSSIDSETGDDETQAPGQTDLSDQASESPAAGAPPVAANNGISSITVPRRRFRILLAEDDPENRKVAMRQLDKLGYAADAVATGLEALEAAARIQYDLVLMDCQMPDLDGYEATREIRRREGASRHTKIVAMTAHALAGDREKCLEAGMDDFISKPVKLSNLTAVLERVMTAHEPASSP